MTEAAYALVIGESIVDIVRSPDGHVVEHDGGSGANTAVALARLGRPVRFATAFAGDDRGVRLGRRLDDAGIRTATDPHVVARTSSATAELAEDGSARYDFDLEWRLGPTTMEYPPHIVHFGSLAAVLQPGATQVMRLAGRFRDRALVSYDINMRPTATGVSATVVGAVELAVSLAHVVKASNEDLAVLYPGLDLDDAAHRLLHLGSSAVVVTRGADGAAWFDTKRRIDVAAQPTTVVDTIGAGDTFSAAMLDALWNEPKPAGLSGPGVCALLAYGARAAAITVSRPGANPPRRDELDLDSREAGGVHPVSVSEAW
ncbi:MAG: PfkB family carbohydrate kinase [Nocardioides sp.]|uniref:PfkB family carbohydrate kinase n=1 Tax=Nocardioides sp. TaxID=35761 RepID=UPI0039E63D6D